MTFPTWKFVAIETKIRLPIFQVKAPKSDSPPAPPVMPVKAPVTPVIQDGVEGGGSFEGLGKLAVLQASFQNFRNFWGGLGCIISGNNPVMKWLSAFGYCYDT